VAGVAVFNEEGADGGFEERDGSAIVGILCSRRGEEYPQPQSPKENGTTHPNTISPMAVGCCRSGLKADKNGRPTEEPG